MESVIKILRTIFSFLLVYGSVASAEVPSSFVDLSEINPSIQIEMRYFSRWNFTGHRIAGYNANKCYLTTEAAKALSDVQKDLNRIGLSLLVFDCYRPQRSVTEFYKWSQDLADLSMRKIFYPEEPKDKLFERGYIAQKSGHSRGSTVDLTLIKQKDSSQNGGPSERLRFQEQATDCRSPGKIESTGQLNMGTTFDCFSDLAATSNPEVSPTARKNRQILKKAMEKFGFVNYPKEWWHFTFKNEPFKDSYFDFEIQ